MSTIAVLIVAAGKGERAGGAVPKQYQSLSGKPVLRRSLEAFADQVKFMQVVIGTDDEVHYSIAVEGLPVLPVLAGGPTRQHSVMHGLEALSARKPDFVLIHDAARPLVSAACIKRVIDALEKGADAAVPLLPVADTLRKQIDGKWTTVPRDGMYRAQTPQGFRFAAIHKAHRDFAKLDVTDDMALAELAGLKIEMVMGEERNMKITEPGDMQLAEKLLGGGETRTGFGLDAHRFEPGDHVWLCGVKIPHTAKLKGHSDADAGLHALTDAILGAISEGDIGKHFPPTDEQWRGASSDRFLAHAGKLVADKGGTILHCDITLICERPKIGPHVEAMRARIGEILGIDKSRVSVKATTTEEMGFTGRKEGLAAQAVATVRLP